jgi:hypothetical protein
VIVIDGKMLRGSFDKASNKSVIHMISTWASVNSNSLGQWVVDAKSNEITAIQKSAGHSAAQGGDCDD